MLSSLLLSLSSLLPERKERQRGINKSSPCVPRERAFSHAWGGRTDVTLIEKHSTRDPTDLFPVHREVCSSLRTRHGNTTYQGVGWVDMA